MSRLLSAGVSGCSSSADGMVQWISFNCLGDLFLVIVNDELCIFNTNPLNTLFRLTSDQFAENFPEQDNFPLFKADILDRTNMLAIIPASISVQPRSADNRIWFWDCNKNSLLCEYIADRPILMVRMRRNMCALTTENEVKFLSLPNFEVLVSVPTRNSLGILTLTSNASGTHQLAAFPYVDNPIGGVHVVRISMHGSSIKVEKAFRAHDHPISCMVFNSDGSYLATASTQGTLINLWKTDNMKRVLRLRRGIDPALIYSLAFNYDSSLLAAISDNGTVHVFCTSVNDINVKTPKRDSFTKFVTPMTGIRAVSKYDISCRSYSQCAILENSVFVITVDCDFHHLIYSTDNSICKRIVFDKFIDPFDDTGL